MQINPIGQFRDAIQAAGLVPPADIEPDGKLRRFSSNGKKADDAGWSPKPWGVGAIVSRGAASGG